MHNCVGQSYLQIYIYLQLPPQSSSILTYGATMAFVEKCTLISSYYSRKRAYVNVCLFNSDNQSPKYPKKVSDVCFGVNRNQQHGGSILNFINLCKTFRRISEVWENAQTWNLEKFMFSLFISFNITISWLYLSGFRFFLCVTVKTIYTQSFIKWLGERRNKFL